jgi:hypothetical protein
VSEKIRIELQPKDEFWAKAFAVEWGDRFPKRELVPAGPRQFLADAAWVADIERVAGQCFCTAVVAPVNPDRRAWIRLFSPGGYLK